MDPPACSGPARARLSRPKAGLAGPPLGAGQARRSFPVPHPAKSRGLPRQSFPLGNIEILSNLLNICSEKSGDKMLVKFEMYFDGVHWCARGIGVSIFTEGRTLDELMENIKEATSLHFEDVLETGEELKILSISEFEVQPLAKAPGC